MAVQQLRQDTPREYRLGHDERAGVERVAGKLCEAEVGVDSRQWVSAARTAWEHLPSSLRAAVHRFRRDSGESGTLLLRGVPVDAASLPPTPTEDESVQRSPSVTAAALTLLAVGLGEPIAFSAEKKGALVQDVVPVPGKEAVQGNAGTTELSLHVENAFHPFRPDYVLLLCLRPDHDRNAALRVACVRRTLPLLSTPDRDTLFRPEFVTAAPPSFGDTLSTATHAVLSGDPTDPDVRVDFAATTATTPEAQRALSALRAAFGRTAQALRLATGDLVVVDNRVAAHGRSVFHARYDGGDRWLQRTFVQVDLRRSRSARAGDSHVIST